MTEALAAALGVAIKDTQPVGGGDICRAARATLADGRQIFIKTRPGAPADFFRTEAAGLEQLAKAGGAPTPAVLAVTDDALAREWIEPGPPNPRTAEEFGRALAVTHRAGSPHFGGDGDGYLGSLRLPNRPARTWAELYREQRVGPALAKAIERDAISPADALDVAQVLANLETFAGPDEPPALLHGDLWAGNVHWSAAGPVYLIDPAVHGGHRETDLAMLALFGAPLLDRILVGYDAVYPPAPGRERRVPLHQLHPVVVHAALFGGGYGPRAGALARAVLGRG
ncbi:MAG TPA: fructosamine kinase family protein [Sporichthyaceae bacterium]